MSYPDNRKFKVSACGSNNPVGVLRQSYGLGVYGPRSEVKEGDLVAACKCCPEVRYLSATIEWVGYEAFTCPGGPGPDLDNKERTKYLVYTTSGEASVSDCSGAADYQTANATQSWTIDPLTGLPSYSGSGNQNVSYLCSSGTSTCSPTQKQKTCTISVSGDPCAPASETGEREVSFTETLSGDYRLNDVAGRIDQAVGRLDLYSESQGIPDGTVGFLENGTGHSIVRLSPAQNAYISGVCPGCPGQLNALWVETYNPTTRQWFVTKQYIYIKFKDRTEYKVYRKDLTTGEIKESEETDSGKKIIKADKLNEEVWVTVSSGNQFFGCGDGYKCACSTMHGCEDTGTKIYKQSAEPCTPLIGPDCQQYLSSMYTEIATGTAGGFGTYTLNGRPEIDGSESVSFQKTSSVQTTACPALSLENTIESESGGGSATYGYGGGSSFTANYRKTVSNNVETSTGVIRGEYGAFGQGACQCQTTITTPVTIEEDEFTGPDGETIGSETTSCTTTIEGATITTQSSYEYHTQRSGSTENTSISNKYDISATRTSTTVWENPDSPEGGLETVSDETNYTNSAWFETGFNGLGRYYVSKADVKKKCEVKFTACETNQTIVPFDQPVEYEVLLHCAIRTLNQEDPQNPILTWEVDNQLKTVRSKGGEEAESFDIDIPTPATDKTVTALAYSTCTVWKKPS